MGIGEAIAITLAEKGMNIAILARSKVIQPNRYAWCYVYWQYLPKDKLENVRAKIQQKSPSIRVQAFPVDIQNHTDVDAAVQNAIAELGEIEVLINNVIPTLTPTHYFG